MAPGAAMGNDRRSRVIRFSLASLLGFGALNAFAGGYYGLSGAEGVPLEWLAGSPFSDYTIPSAILFVVVGGSMLAAAIAVATRARVARAAAMAAGAIVLIWIAVQIAIIGYVSWMQPATAAGGLAVLTLASRVERRARGLAKTSREPRWGAA